MPGEHIHYYMLRPEDPSVVWKWPDGEAFVPQPREGLCVCGASALLGLTPDQRERLRDVATARNDAVEEE